MLCVHNLARSAQAVELDLSAYEGRSPGRDVRPLALPADRRAAVPAHARAARLLLVPARRRTRRSDDVDAVRILDDGACSSEWIVAAALVRLQVARGRAASTSSRRRRCATSRRCSCSRWSRRASPTGTHEPYQVPLGLRPADEGWDERVIGEAGGWTVYDALADPAAGRELLHRDARSATSTVEDGTLRFRWAESPARGLGGTVDVRPVGVEQSNSSIVFGEELILKVVPARRAGRRTRSSSCCASCPTREFPHIAPLAGWYEFEGRLIDATLGILQEYLAGARDGWELALDELAATRTASSARLRALGEVTGELHTVLGSDAADPDFAPEEPSQRGAVAADRRRRRADRADLPRPAGDARRSRRSPAAARTCASGSQALSHIGAGGRVIRTHGDYHLGQTMLTDARLGDPRLRGRAGAAAARAAAEALAAARRGGDAALVLLRDRGGAAAARRRRAGGLGGARASGVPRGLLRARRLGLLPPGEAGRPRSCCRCSSSRRPSTSCATSSTTGPTGSASRWPGSCGCSRATDQSPGSSGRACDHSSGFDHDFGRGCTRYLPC